MESSPASLQIWFDGKLVSKQDARVSVYDHGLLYGDGVFEGIRQYNGRVFEKEAHLRRLYESAMIATDGVAQFFGEIPRYPTPRVTTSRM